MTHMTRRKWNLIHMGVPPQMCLHIGHNWVWFSTLLMLPFIRQQWCQCHSVKGMTKGSLHGRSLRGWASTLYIVDEVGNDGFHSLCIISTIHMIYLINVPFLDLTTSCEMLINSLGLTIYLHTYGVQMKC